MNKLVALCAGALAIPAAMGVTAVVNTPVAGSEPANVQSLNVVGEPYGRAVAILKSQGIKPMFGGSVGSDMPQAQCVVDTQEFITNGRIKLNLNCTEEAAADANATLPAGVQGPTVGSNGVTTVKATPVGPQPGMPVAPAPPG